MPGYKLSIDLGTCNTAAYTCINGVFDYVPLDNDRLLPTFVEYKDNGDVSVGASAKVAAKRRRACVISNSKRIIGRQFTDSDIQSMGEYCGVPIVDINNKPYFYIKSLEKNVSPEEIAQQVVMKVISASYEKAKQPLDGILVTVPAHFNNNQLTATIHAVEMAIESCRKTIPISRNIEVKSMKEPTAAAYCFYCNDDNKNKRALVYDFGGGTFDVTIIELNSKNPEVKVSRGNNHLGGSDIDRRISDYFIKKYFEEFHEECIPPDLNESAKTSYLRAIISEAEKKKILLSNTASIQVEYTDYGHMTIDSDEEEPPTFVFNRTILNDLIKDIIDQTFDVVNDCLRTANYRPDDIDMVVLVGGSSHLTIVKERLEKMFKGKVRQTLNASLCVAEGGCRYLHDLSYTSNPIHDITTFSLDSSISNERACCIIPKGIKIPCEYSYQFRQSRDYMERIDSTLYQGNCTESGEVYHLRDDRGKIGVYGYSGFRKDIIPNVTFVETYSYTQMGIVHIHVVEQETGKVLLDKDVNWDDVK